MTINSSVAGVLATTAAAADLAAPYVARAPNGFPEPTQYVRAQIARSVVINLRSASLPAHFNKDGRLIRVPRAELAGHSSKIDAGVVANSRVAWAGAHVSVQSDNRKAHGVGTRGGIAMEDVPVEFRTIEAAEFGVIDIDAEDDAPTIDLPVLGASMSWKNSTDLAVRFELARSARRRKRPEDLFEEISAALSLGLARAADSVLLAAVASTAPATFSVASAAARGVRIDELSAIVGTGGAGATIGEDGVLRAAGVRAELTPDASSTIIGAWNRCGIAVNEEVTVRFERLGRSGHLACTAWAKMLPLVPDGSAFWAIS